MPNTPAVLSVDAFAAANPPRRRGRMSRIAAWRGSVFDLHARGYGAVQIAQYLAANGVKVSPAAVGDYIRRELAKDGIDE